MNDWENALTKVSGVNDESYNFDELEKTLQADLDEQLSDLEILKEDRDKISNPDSLGTTVMNIVWEQFVNQIGVIAGEDFIAANRNMTLDLRDSAHIQTTKNFSNGKIASHNDKIDYQKRYDDWQSNFQKDESGTVVTHKTRSGKDEATLVNGARDPFDKERPTGSVQNHTDMDHTVPAAEIIRDPAANAHMTREDQIAFANSEKNLNEMDSSLNRSKGDKSMSDWLDNPNSKGQKPDEVFDISEKDAEKLRQKDAESREEYEKQKKEAEERSVKAGKQSQKEEAFRIGGKALRAVVMGLLMELVKNIFQKFVAWLRSGEKNFQTFIGQIKNALVDFVCNLKQNILTAGNTMVTTIATAIVGPIIGTLKKAWMFLKQGAKSLKEAIAYIKDPDNRQKSIGVLMLEVGKIVMGGLTVAGAIVLGEVIEKGLMAIPVFAVEIPLIGSLASILGIFLGSLVAGLIGALALNLIDRAVAKKLKIENTGKQIDEKNKILDTQGQLTNVKVHQIVKTKEQAIQCMRQRREQAKEIIGDAMCTIFRDDESEEETRNQLHVIDDNLDVLLN